LIGSEIRHAAPRLCGHDNYVAATSVDVATLAALRARPFFGSDKVVFAADTSLGPIKPA
jgi:hypothetical protein